MAIVAGELMPAALGSLASWWIALAFSCGGGDVGKLSDSGALDWRGLDPSAKTLALGKLTARP